MLAQTHEDADNLQKPGLQNNKVWMALQAKKTANIPIRSWLVNTCWLLEVFRRLQVPE